MNKQKLIDKYTAEISRLRPYFPNRHLISEQLKYDLYKEILEDLKQLDEPQKPVVPKFVADWIEYAKKKGDSLAISFKPWNLYGVEYSKADRWIEDNQETFARAWIDGYEVEKEPLYYVRLPYEVWDEEAAELKTEYLYLHYEITSDETRIFPTKEPRKSFVAKLDELTIKSADERYWPFAVPVEAE
ncbi:DUF1642 domain-containing protein [Enterococcus lactis]|uniref:DUF1642 domain-containing protein n=1 Tax=Enterococcus lactis TaxID=357441 RepID=UPI001CF26E1F|nr:DUF1642 domain-containing protein [Enterococcus lactis]MCA6745992.1 DUF1642 domain-containing protein [Enterococcus lactis]